jgi:hypothetical protein
VKQSAAVSLKAIMVSGELLKQIPVRASFDPCLPARDHADGTVAEDKLHAGGMSAAERPEAGALAEAGRERVAIAIGCHRGALQSWTAAKPQSAAIAMRYHRRGGLVSRRATVAEGRDESLSAEVRAA